MVSMDEGGTSDRGGGGGSGVGGGEGAHWLLDGVEDEDEDEAGLPAGLFSELLAACCHGGRGGGRCSNLSSNETHKLQ